MPDMTAIAQAFGALKALKDIGEAMIGLRDASAFRERQIEFQQRIIDAQSAISAVQQENAALTERIRHLEKEINNLKAWEGEKQRYELQSLGNGNSFAYALKTMEQETEPFHYICAACYQHNKKSILQIMPTSEVSIHLSIPDKYQCPECKAEVVV